MRPVLRRLMETMEARPPDLCDEGDAVLFLEPGRNAVIAPCRRGRSALHASGSAKALGAYARP